MLACVTALAVVASTQAASYDGDRRDDMVVWRPGTGTWHVLTSSTSFVSSFSRQWGTQGDIPLAPGAK